MSVPSLLLCCYHKHYDFKKVKGGKVFILAHRLIAYYERKDQDGLELQAGVRKQELLIVAL